MESAAARGELEGRQKSDGVWRALHAVERLRRHGLSRCRTERGLPLSECVDAESGAGSEAAGHGVDFWWGISGGSDVRAKAGWRSAGAPGRRGSEHELPAGNIWFFFAPGIDQGISASCFGELWTAGPGGG